MQHHCAVRDALRLRRRPGRVRRPRVDRVAVHARRPDRLRAGPRRVPGIQASRAAAHRASTCECWYNAITLARSTDGGRTFTHAAGRRGTWSPRSRTATSPTPARSASSQPSNIVRNEATATTTRWSRAQRYRQQQRRHLPDADHAPRPTRRPGGPGTARASTSRFVDPYAAAASRRGPRLRARVVPDEIADMSQSLTYNTYFEQVHAGRAGRSVRSAASGRSVCGLLLLALRRPDPLGAAQADPRGRVRTGPTSAAIPNPVAYPSVLDPSSTSRNFETAGRTSVPLLHAVPLHATASRRSNRDLVRVPMRFSK